VLPRQNFTDNKWTVPRDYFLHASENPVFEVFDVNLHNIDLHRVEVLEVVKSSSLDFKRWRLFPALPSILNQCTGSFAIFAFAWGKKECCSSRTVGQSQIERRYSRLEPVQ
jgi:hypothetical protein